MAPPLRRVLVVGSINVDLYQRLQGGSAKFAGREVSLAPIKGQTLPARSFVKNAAVAKEMDKLGVRCAEGEEEALVLTMDGPFEQKTGGKGANAAAAAGCTYACEFLGNFGESSAAENDALLADLAKYGAVATDRCATLAGLPTGTAYIMLFDDNDNAILLLGGANQSWPPAEALESAGSPLGAALDAAVAVMLQREVPEYVNVAVARLARAKDVPVFMDVGGTDAPLDPALLPHISVIAPNESELTFITGVPTGGAGVVEMGKVREAVGVLKAKFAEAGNADIEVLVTLGKLGSVYFGAKWRADLQGGASEEVRMGSFALSTADGMPEDTTGAGDCYRGSFVGARYGLGSDLAEAMRWAAAAASLAVEVKGAMPSMPPRAKIEERAASKMICHE